MPERFFYTREPILGLYQIMRREGVTKMSVVAELGIKRESGLNGEELATLICDYLEGKVDA